jgi:hypothetical protein
MSIFSVFGIVGLLAAFGFGTLPSHHALGGMPAASTGAATGAASAVRRSDVIGTKAARRPLDTVGGSPA